MRAITTHRAIFNNLFKTINNITRIAPRKIIMSASSDHQVSGFNRPRLVVKKVLAKPQSEGDGAVVRRSIGRYIFFLLNLSLSLWVLFALVFVLFEFLFVTEILN